MVIFLNWWVTRSSCFNTIYRHIQCIQWKLYQTEIFLFNIFLRNKRFRKQMWRIQAGGCFWRKPSGLCCNANLLFTIFQFPSWEWGFQNLWLNEMQKGVGNCFTLKLASNFILFFIGMWIFFWGWPWYSQLRKKNRLILLFDVLHEKKNSLLNRWYEFNPFAFHSQGCWDYRL